MKIRKNVIIVASGHQLTRYVVIYGIEIMKIYKNLIVIVVAYTLRCYLQAKFFKNYKS